MDRIRVIRSWALKVIEFGPQGARRDALGFLEEVEAAMRIDVEQGVVLDGLAEDVLKLCLENLIQAPPGLHGRLLRREEYRSRVPWMRSL